MNDPENTSIKQVWQRIPRPVEFPASPYSLTKATLEALQAIPEGEARWLDCNGVNFEALEASTNGRWTISNQIKNTIYGPPIPGAMLAYRSNPLPEVIQYPDFTPEWSAACESKKQERAEQIRAGTYRPTEGSLDWIDLIAAQHDFLQAGDIPNAIKALDLRLALKGNTNQETDTLLDERLNLSSALDRQTPET